MRRATWQWLIAGGVLLLGAPSGSAPGDDGAPRGMVAFFAAGSGCPDGWQAASAAAGRLVVGVRDVNDVGSRVGLPLGDREDRAHLHAFSAGAMIGVKNLAAADGGNQSAAQPGASTTAGSTLPARTGLPFTQLIVCRRP